MDVKQLSGDQAREVLDHILANTYDPRDYIHVKEFFLEKDTFLPSNDEYFLQMALNKIRQDGYIDFIKKVHEKKWIYADPLEQAGEGLTIRRNFNGHLFYSKGGYLGERERIIREGSDENAYRERAETLATDLRDWTRILAVRTNQLKNWTKAVAIGAIGLVIWEILAHFLDHP